MNNASLGTVASQLPSRRRSIRPAIGATYEGHDPFLLERMLPHVEYIEVTPDSIAETNGDTITLNKEIMAELKNAQHAVNIIVHGIGLSIGSYDGYSENYLRLLDDFLEQIDVPWHSEHLGYTMVDGESLGTMLTLPKTNEALDMICERVFQIHERYKIPFLLENVVHLLPDDESDYTDAQFLNALTERTGCGLILDVYNMECDAHNHHFDIKEFLAELHLKAVREVHVAGGTEYRGMKVDIHSRQLEQSTLTLAQHVVDRAEGTIDVVTFEFLREAIPSLGYETIISELKNLNTAFGE
ncbi:MAG: DUF692 family protein [Ignavibacteria bacterium]|nr:DUF692 family protein [Ignavibacteria bacterium]